MNLVHNGAIVFLSKLIPKTGFKNLPRCILIEKVNDKTNLTVKHF